MIYLEDYMKILVADKMAKTALEALENLGAQITFNPDLGADDLPSAIADHEMLIVRSTKVQAPTIDEAQNLKVIIRAGAGTNTIDVDKAASKNIYVCNCPGTNSDAVAELAIGHLIAADRRIVFANSDMRNNKWRKKEYQNSRGLKGRTLGVVGVGAIGKCVISRAKGMEMNVIAWSRSLTPEKAQELGVTRCETPYEVASQADAISLHVAVKPETKHLVNEEFLSKMKDGAILVNCARGEIIDTAALKAAITSKGLRVGLDVFENEPTGGEDVFNDTELANMAVCTPHIGASTDQAADAVGNEVIRIVSVFKETGKPVNSVNL
jgi:D-3-phosphoglycerate dehydrogenase / 2-oxoglutarate reductase